MPDARSPTNSRVWSQAWRIALEWLYDRHGGPRGRGGNRALGTPSPVRKLKVVEAPTDREGASIAAALRTLELECDGLAALRAALANGMGQAFARAVDILASTRGRVIVTGIGKSGHVAQKLAATFASTGTPSFFVHPSEASHGDLGMISREDVIVAISWSGESAELGNILTYSRRFKVPLIAITSRPDSTLTKQSDVVLELLRAKEACPHGLAPTTSTT